MKQVDQIPNFFLRSNGTFYVRKIVRGRAVWKTTGFKSKTKALRRYHEILNDIYDGREDWAETKIPTLGEWWEVYRTAKRKSPKTLKRDADVMRLRILPKYRHIALDQFTQSTWERHFNARRKQKMPNGKLPAKDTVTRELQFVKALFQAAVEDDLISKNPLRKIKRPAYTTRQRVITAVEQAQLMQALDEDWRRWFIFVLGTGVRAEEVHGIIPSRDIDWFAGTVAVTGKGSHGEPKARTVPFLDASLIPLLRAQVAANARQRTGVEWRHGDRRDRLWPQSQDRYRQILTAACKVTGVDFFSPHTLRHTFATRYLQSGGDIYALSKILGHSSVVVTEKVYAHLVTADLVKMSRDRKVDLQLPTAVA